MQITLMRDCVGCAICESYCPVNAIQMKSWNEQLGFQYPIIDETKCVSCNRCVSICTANRECVKNKPLRYEIAQANDKGDLCTATSGGVATALAKQFIRKQNGIVYGAAFHSNMQVAHIRCVSIEDCDRLKGSKYVQSDLTSIHQSIQDDLKNGRAVLFIGTPCQCASMTVFHNYANFYMCDLVCNGVGSPDVFKKHIEFIQQKYKEKIKNYIFRPKTSRYLEPFELVEFRDTKSVRLLSPWEKWGTLYYNALVMRECCYSCKFTSIDRVGDITFSDVPMQLMESCKLKEDVRQYGATYISVNTLKGNYIMELIHAICSYGTAEEFRKERMKDAISKSPLREQFVSYYQNSSLEKAKIKVFGRKTKIKGLVIKLINRSAK